MIVRNLREFLSPERLAETLVSAAENAGGQEKLEADRASIKRDIEEIDRKLANLRRAIEDGGSEFQSLRAGVRERELERHDLEAELQRLETAAKATVEKGKLLDELQEHFDSWYPVLTARPEHVAAARQILRKLLAGPVICYPHFDDEARCWRYVGMGTLDGLIRGAVGRMTYNFANKWKLETPDTPPHTDHAAPAAG